MSGIPGPWSSNVRAEPGRGPSFSISSLAVPHPVHEQRTNSLAAVKTLV